MHTIDVRFGNSLLIYHLPLSWNRYHNSQIRRNEVVLEPLAVQKRYFIVREVDINEYETREVRSDVAFGVQQFVTTVGRCKQSPQEEWVFYFMYMNLSAELANDIAGRIVDKLCSHKLDCSTEVNTTIVTSNGCKPGYNMNEVSATVSSKPTTQSPQQSSKSASRASSIPSNASVDTPSLD